ncbi:glucose 1-dehydrogenase [Fodinicurvata sp. EGI_FJ10296]|uniref:glucose 1-dehydrogenase n=1 Tax=Fodinicurvata sp. EGI_FJ10296 TaxID=3231908 RepID=UPI0034570E94
MGRVSGKVAMVTGAALGLGRAAALMLAREGATIIASDIQVEEGKAVVKAITDEGGKAYFVEHDVATEEGWDAALSQALAMAGKLDVLVNNAGVALSGSVEETTLEDWRRLMSINLDGVFLGTKHAIAAMKTSGGGSIINLSSIEGLVGDPNLAAYNASKGGVRIFTKSAALHCGKAGYNIRVNSVHPGYIWTPMVENFLKSQGDVEEGRRYLNSLHPIGHIGEPDDIANAILYLASDESKFVTGSELVVDGGYTAQ